MFRVHKGRWIVKEFILSANVAVSEGDFIYPDPSNAGQVTIADSTAGNLLGIAVKDYDSSASTQTIHVLVPLEDTCEVEGPIEAGTFTSADLNKFCDLNSEDGVAIDTANKKHLWVVGYKDSSTGIFRIAARPENVQVDTT